MTPEVVLTGFVGGERERKMAEPIPGPSCEHFAALAKELGIYILVGLSELRDGEIMNAVAVLSRADEIGACRIHAMESARRIAQRYAQDPSVSTLVADVLPVAGLLAETGLTLTQNEFTALAQLAALPEDERVMLLLSVDDFCDVSLSPLTVEIRRDLLARFGMFGVRTAVGALADG